MQNKHALLRDFELEGQNKRGAAGGNERLQFERLIVDLKKEKGLRWRWWGGRNNFAMCDQLPLSHVS